MSQPMKYKYFEMFNSIKIKKIRNNKKIQRKKEI